MRAPIPPTPEAWLAALALPQADRDYRPGHARVQALAEACGLSAWCPKLRIRIAGTNGKGSTARFLAAALGAIGLRVGLYTSPHLVRFAERIAIDGQPAPDAMLRKALARIVPHAEAIGASWFETATVLALHCFAEAKVDVEILEAGVGARFDATTAFDADVALLAPIGRDHCAWLGNTLAAIAEDKAHVFHGCRLCLSAPQCAEAMAVLLRHAPDLRIASSWQGALAAAGDFQRINAGLAWAALQAMIEAGMIRADESMLLRAQAAIASLSLPGRMQRLSVEGGELWLDVAHNEHAARALLPALARLAPWQAIVVAVRENRKALPLLHHWRTFALTAAVCAPRDAAAVAACLLQPKGRVLVAGSHEAVGACLARWAQ